LARAASESFRILKNRNSKAATNRIFFDQDAGEQFGEHWRKPKLIANGYLPV
jgi:hypothetical protein